MWRVRTGVDGMEVDRNSSNVLDRTREGTAILRGGDNVRSRITVDTIDRGSVASRWGEVCGEITSSSTTASCEGRYSVRLGFVCDDGCSGGGEVFERFNGGKAPFWPLRSLLSPSCAPVLSANEWSVLASALFLVTGDSGWSTTTGRVGCDSEVMLVATCRGLLSCDWLNERWSSPCSCCDIGICVRVVCVNRKVKKIDN